MGMPSQRETLAFVDMRWPYRHDLEWRALKLCEEAGEVAGAVAKSHPDDGRKTAADVRQETAQVVIVAMSLAEAAGFSLRDAVIEEWERVTQEATDHA